MKPRFDFSSNPKYDIELLIETEGLNPFFPSSDKLRKAVWKEIAQNLNNSDIKMDAADRSCRERIQRLLKEFREDEYLSKTASGIAEDDLSLTKNLLGRMQQLLTDSGNLSILYGKRKREAAETTRSQALTSIDLGTVDDDEEVNENSIPHDSFEETAAAADPNESHKTPKTLKIRDTLAFLAKKNEAKMTFKSAELEVRKLEAENRKMQQSASLDLPKSFTKSTYLARSQHLNFF